jgi:hypothetical protein
MNPYYLRHKYLAPVSTCQFVGLGGGVAKISSDRPDGFDGADSCTNRGVLAAGIAASDPLATAAICHDSAAARTLIYQDDVLISTLRHSADPLFQRNLCISKTPPRDGRRDGPLNDEPARRRVFTAWIYFEPV